MRFADATYKWTCIEMVTLDVKKALSREMQVVPPVVNQVCRPSPHTAAWCRTCSATILAAHPILAAVGALGPARCLVSRRAKGAFGVVLPAGGAALIDCVRILVSRRRKSAPCAGTAPMRARNARALWTAPPPLRCPPERGFRYNGGLRPETGFTAEGLLLGLE